MLKEKIVVFVRSTNVQFDSRVQKEITSVLKAGYKCIILAWNRNNQEEVNNIFKTTYGNAEVIYYKKSAEFGGGLASIGKFIGFNIWLYSMLKKIIDEFSIIHACDLDTAIPCIIISKKFNKILIYDIFDYYIHSHNIPTKLGKKIVSHIEDMIINKAFCTIICSEQRLDQIKHTKPLRVEIIHNSPEVEHITQNSIFKQINSEKLKVVYVGALLNDRLLIESIKQIIELKDVELFIGGYGILEKEILDYSTISDNIHFLGQMEYKHVLELENSCDVMFATYNPDVENHKYSAPNKIYEAMALGKPIIVCRGTGIDLIVDEEGIGISISYNGSEFLEAILNLTSKEIRETMGRKGRALYLSKYSWRVMEMRLCSIYEDAFKCIESID